MANTFFEPDELRFAKAVGAEMRILRDAKGLTLQETAQSALGRDRDWCAKIERAIFRVGAEDWFRVMLLLTDDDESHPARVLARALGIKAMTATGLPDISLYAFLRTINFLQETNPFVAAAEISRRYGMV